MPPDSTPPAPDERMVQTRWSQVLLSQGQTAEAKMALKDLAEAYYDPVYRFIRQRSAGEDHARDLTQEFFARVLDRYGFDGADPARGRFRSFLLGAVKHFLSEKRAYDRRAKRGGGAVDQPLDRGERGQEGNGPRLQMADEGTLPPDRAFDRSWALAVLDRALTRVKADCAARGKARHFDVLQPWLAGGADEPQATAAVRLGLSESATRVAIHRLRRQFRHAVRGELAHTVGPGDSVDEELRHLFAALEGRD